MDEKKQDEYHFVKEQIKDIPPDRRRRRRRIVRLLLCAALFGAVASLVFALLQPCFLKLLDRNQNEEILLSDAEESADAAEEESSSDPEQVIIRETQEMELSDYQVLQDKLYAIGKEANKSVVAITSITSTQDWFDSDYESTGSGAGLIVAETTQQLIIVTERKLIADANQIHVMFFDNADAEAQLVAYDGDTGIAVISVEKSLLSDSTLNAAVPAELGSSSAVRQGTMVIAIGSPLGDAYSILTGNVTSTGYQVTAVDGNYEVITTDISAAENGSGALINLDGQVVGLIMQSYSSQSRQSTVTALGIAEIRELVESLSNGKMPAYLGLEISTVTSRIAEANQLPEGVYIKAVREDSPAAQSGLQTGDVIVAINDEEVLTESQYESFLAGCFEGDQIRVTVKRMGGDGSYQELTCEAVLGVLN